MKFQSELAQGGTSKAELISSSDPRFTGWRSEDERRPMIETYQILGADRIICTGVAKENVPLIERAPLLLASVTKALEFLDDIDDDEFLVEAFEERALGDRLREIHAQLQSAVIDHGAQREQEAA